MLRKWIKETPVLRSAEGVGGGDFIARMNAYNASREDRTMTIAENTGESGDTRKAAEKVQ